MTASLDPTPPPPVVWVLTDTDAVYEFEQDLRGVAGVYSNREAAESEAALLHRAYKALLESGEPAAPRLISVTPWAVRS